MELLIGLTIYNIIYQLVDFKSKALNFRIANSEEQYKANLEERGSKV